MKATEMVRNFAAVNGTVQKKQIKKSLDLSQDQVVYAVNTLVDQGYLIRIGHGLYQFSDIVEKPLADITDKVWRAMGIRPSFSASDIAKLSGSTVNYIYKLFRAFKADGFIKNAGVRPVPGSREKLYRLTIKGEKQALNPKLETFKPDPLVMAVVNLNRLICSGVAIRDQEAGEIALKLVEQIKNGLEDAATS